MPKLSTPKFSKSSKNQTAKRLTSSRDTAEIKKRRDVFQIYYNKEMKKKHQLMEESLRIAGPSNSISDHHSNTSDSTVTRLKKKISVKSPEVIKRTNTIAIKNSRRQNLLNRKNSAMELFFSKVSRIIRQTSKLQEDSLVKKPIKEVDQISSIKETFGDNKTPSPDGSSSFHSDSSITNSVNFRLKIPPIMVNSFDNTHFDKQKLSNPLKPRLSKRHSRTVIKPSNSFLKEISPVATPSIF